MSDRKFSVVVQLFRRLWQGVTQHLLGNGPPPLLLPDFLPTLDFPFPPSVLCSARTHKSPHSPSFLCTQCKRRKPKTDLWMLKIEGGKESEVSGMWVWRQPHFLFSFSCTTHGLPENCIRLLSHLSLPSTSLFHLRETWRFKLLYFAPR